MVAGLYLQYESLCDVMLQRILNQRHVQSRWRGSFTHKVSFGGELSGDITETGCCSPFFNIQGCCFGRVCCSLSEEESDE